MSDPSSQPKKRTRSRFGCHRCKRLKVKCDETKPSCSLCVKANAECDYSIKLTWGGRPFKKQKDNNLGLETILSFDQKFQSKPSSRSSSATPPAPPIPSGDQVIEFDTPVSVDASQSTKKTAKPVQTPLDQKPILLEPTPPPLPKQSRSLKQASSRVTKPTISKPRSTPLLRSNNDTSHLQNVSQDTSINTPDQLPRQPSELSELHETLSHPVTPTLEGAVDLSSLLNPADGAYMPDPCDTNTMYSLEDNMTIPDMQDSRMLVAFRDIPTSNPVVKQYVNDVLLPDLNGINPNFRSDSEEDSSPESLTFMENFHSFKWNHPGPTDNQFEFFSDPSRFFTGFESVPETIDPLPDLIRNNPLYREYYHGYINVFSRALCPAPRYTDNPFTTLLPKMAVSSGTDGLISVLISFGVCMKASYAGAIYPEDPVKDLISRALNDLYKRLTDPLEANSDYTLGLIMVLSCFEIICGKGHGWRAHFFGAKNIMLARGFLKFASKRSNNAIFDAVPVTLERARETDLPFFFLRWFAYIDVIGALSSSSHVYMGNARTGDFLWETEKVTYADRERLNDIDPFLGFELHVMQHLSKIIHLVKERERAFSEGKALPVELIQKALEAKEDLMNYITETEAYRDEIEAKLIADPMNLLNDRIPDYKVLRATNLVFSLAGVLQIYRRVLMVPRESPIVQDIIQRSASSFEQYIDVDVPAAYCTVFSLFSNGCDAIDEQTRQFYLHRIDSLAINGMFSASIAHDIMQESWVTGKYWADIIAERNIDVVFV